MMQDLEHAGKRSPRKAVGVRLGEVLAAVGGALLTFDLVSLPICAPPQ